MCIVMSIHVYRPKEFLAIKAGYFPKRDVRFYFVEITTGDPRHIQQIHIDEPYLHPCRPRPIERIF